MEKAKLKMNLQTFTEGTSTAVTKELERKALLHYINVTPSADTPTWFLIGKDIDDMSVDLNPSVDAKTNIWGEQSVDDNGYTPSLEADPYYAKPSDALYPWLSNIAFEQLTGDDCKTQILEVIIDTTASPYTAYTQDVIVKPKSYGGKTKVNIPYEIHYAGNRTKGTVAITNKVPTFTAAA